MSPFTEAHLKQIIIIAAIALLAAAPADPRAWSIPARLLPNTAKRPKSAAPSRYVSVNAP